MNASLEQRRKSLDRYLRQLTQDELDLPFHPLDLRCDALTHGDHNLNVKLRITGAADETLFRCLRIDCSDSVEYKRKEYECLKHLQGCGIGPQVFSWKEQPPMLIREWIEALSPVSDMLDNRRTTFFRACAALYRRLHAVDISAYLSAGEKTQNPRSRYCDFLNALTEAAQAQHTRLETWQATFLHQLAGQDIQDIPVRGTPSIAQLSPKIGNLVLYRGSPFFLDWDTVRYTDKERDLAVFIGVYAERINEIVDLLALLPHYNIRLIAHYLCPVMLWREFRGGERLNQKRYQFLKELETVFLMAVK